MKAPKCAQIKKFNLKQLHIYFSPRHWTSMSRTVSLIKKGK